MLQDILLVVIGLVIGAVIGFFVCKKYMEKYYPDWSKRYKTILKKPEDYIKFKKESAAGKFSWDLENGILKDPDNYRDKKPEEILKDIFGEK